MNSDEHDHLDDFLYKLPPVEYFNQPLRDSFIQLCTMNLMILTYEIAFVIYLLVDMKLNPRPNFDQFQLNNEEDVLQAQEELLQYELTSSMDLIELLLKITLTSLALYGTVNPKSYILVGFMTFGYGIWLTAETMISILWPNLLNYTWFEKLKHFIKTIIYVFQLTQLIVSIFYLINVFSLLNVMKNN